MLGESISITLLDTFVALVSGLIIFPACFAFGVNPDSGFGLIFVTLPNIFNNMPLGQLWGALFFIFLFFAALTTIIAVFENIVSCFTDLFNWSRKKSVLINMIGIMILSMPCLLGFSVWSHVQPLFGGSIMGLEDFLISNNLLPLGSLLYLMFCVSRYGWGWQNFLTEANTGKGLKFPAVFHFYLKWILPLIVLFIFIQAISHILNKPEFSGFYFGLSQQANHTEHWQMQRIKCIHTKLYCFGYAAFLTLIK